MASAPMVSPPAMAVSAFRRESTDLLDLGPAAPPVALQEERATVPARGEAVRAAPARVAHGQAEAVHQEPAAPAPAVAPARAAAEPAPLALYLLLSVNARPASSALRS